VFGWIAGKLAYKLEFLDDIHRLIHKQNRKNEVDYGPTYRGSSGC
jgi:hypothetical protein